MPEGFVSRLNRKKKRGVIRDQNNGFIFPFDTDNVKIKYGDLVKFEKSRDDKGFQAIDVKPAY